MASQLPNPAHLRPKLTIVTLHDTISHPIATPLQVRHAIARAQAATGQVTASASKDAATTARIGDSINPYAVDDSVLATTRAEDVAIATTMEAVQEQIRSERLERQREMRKMRAEKERVARVEKWKRDMEAPIIRYVWCWGRRLSDGYLLKSTEADR